MKCNYDMQALLFKLLFATSFYFGFFSNVNYFPIHLTCGYAQSCGFIYENYVKNSLSQVPGEVSHVPPISPDQFMIPYFCCPGKADLVRMQTLFSDETFLCPS